jgi:cob(I)alamin adenosyltransferase
MPRLTKIYTRKGDEGMTSLSGGQRVRKDSLRVTAYGWVDELNASLGVALAQGLSLRLAKVIAELQNELFHLGSDLSFLEEDKARIEVPQIEARHVQRLEELIDELNEVVGPLENFILPGGSTGAANLHVARTICRHAERAAVTLAAEEGIGPQVIPYLNRLSDALFVMARYENHAQNVAEPLWDSHA